MSELPLEESAARLRRLCEVALGSVQSSVELGIRVESVAPEGISIRLLHGAHLVGNPWNGVVHDGPILARRAIMSQPRMSQTTDLSIDYLRAGHYRDCWASCTVTSQGCRVANVMISCWQETGPR